MALTEQPFAMPGCQGKVRFSDLINPDVCPFKSNGKYDCAGCMQKAPCTDCKYFPIYPCYSAKVCNFFKKVYLVRNCQIFDGTNQVYINVKKHISWWEKTALSLST